MELVGAQLKKILGGVKSQPSLTLDIVLDQSEWVAGSNITGSIVFKRTGPVKLSAVRLRMVGCEVVHISDSYDLPPHKRTKSRIVFDTNILVLFQQKKGEKLDAGETTYPFAIKSPDTAPPSLHYEGKARVAYELSAELVFPSKPSMHSSYPVFLRRPFPTDPALLFNDRKTFLLHPKSPILFRVRFEKPSYESGESVALDIAIDNQSYKQIERLVISVEEKIKYASLKAEALLSSTTIQQPRFPVAPQSKYEEVVTIELPNRLIPTTKGASISSNYRLEFRCEFSDGGDWRTYTPLVIVNTATAMPPLPSHPSLMDQDMASIEPSLRTLHSSMSQDRILERPRSSSHPLSPSTGAAGASATATATASDASSLASSAQAPHLANPLNLQQEAATLASASRSVSDSNSSSNSSSTVLSASIANAPQLPAPVPPSTASSTSTATAAAIAAAGAVAAVSPPAPEPPSAFSANPSQPEPLSESRYPILETTPCLVPTQPPPYHSVAPTVASNAPYYTQHHQPAAAAPEPILSMTSEQLQQQLALLQQQQALLQQQLQIQTRLEQTKQYSDYLAAAYPASSAPDGSAPLPSSIPLSLNQLYMMPPVPGQPAYQPSQ